MDDIEKDAARYRFLRSDIAGDMGVGVWEVKDGLPVPCGWLMDDGLDEAVDAAMRKATNVGGKGLDD